MASRIVFEGIVPECRQTPPGPAPRRSTIATRLFILAAAMAPFWPAGPLPITNRSYRMAGCLPSRWLAAIPLACEQGVPVADSCERLSIIEMRGDGEPREDVPVTDSAVNPGDHDSGNGCAGCRRKAAAVRAFQVGGVAGRSLQGGGPVHLKN